jgi:Leucine-rich repeat (LRR) protein
MEFENLQILPSNFYEFFPNLIKIEITNTLLREIKAENFINLQLEVLKLSDNGIKKIDSQSLNDQNKLKEIHLDYNKIEQIPDEFFSFSPKLEIIQLEHNKIENWNEKLLESLTNLKEIFLNDNQIFIITPNFFKNNLKLEILSVKNNKKCENYEDFIENFVKLERESIDEISDVCSVNFYNGEF